jgi:Ribonuclease G/E
MGSVAIHASWSPGEVRVAAVVGGVVMDYAIWRPGAPDGLGDVWRARIAAVMPAMAGAFVALDGLNDGFLPDSEGGKGVTEGAILTVRVTRAALGGKGVRLSARVPSEGDGPVGLIRRGTDPLRELAARHPAAEIVVDDPGFAAALHSEFRARVRRVADAFDDAIETEVGSLGEPEFILPSGVRVSVQPTRALVAIDVDGGGALSGPDHPGRRHRALNQSVLPELARQIRLRNLSGAILVDLAGLRAKQRAAFGPAISAALAADPVGPRFLGFTALGLAEITRPRMRPPLHELLAGPHAAGLAALRAIGRATRADPGTRLSLRASPSVVAALDSDSVAMPELARITGLALHSRADPSLPADGWRIEDFHG